MLLVMSSVIYDQTHGHVLLILMGKIRIDGQEFTPTKAARYCLRACASGVLGGYHQEWHFIPEKNGAP